jgi:hypothetical protein
MLVEHTLRGLLAYLLIGVVFAPVFVLKGAPRLSPGARGAGRAFRVLILPGAAMLWAPLAWRWLRARHAAGPAKGGDA